MVLNFYDSDRMKRFAYKEASIRIITDTLDEDMKEAAVSPHLIDELSDPTANPPIPAPQTTEQHHIGGGRNVDKVVRRGFNVGEESYPFYLQSGEMFYYLLGACTTQEFHVKDGITWKYATSFDGVTALEVWAYGAAGNVETITLWGFNSDGLWESATAVLTAAVSAQIESSATDKKWLWIYYFTTTLSGTETLTTVSNEAKTDTYLTNEYNAGNFELGNTGTSDTPAETTYYYHHAITETNYQPSWAWAWEWGESNATNDLLKTYLGIHSISSELTMEKGSEAGIIHNVGVKCCKDVTSDSAITTPTGNKILVASMPQVSWHHLKTFRFVYGTYVTANALEGDLLTSYAKSITHTYEPGLNLDHPFGDEHAKLLYPAARTCAIALTYNPRDIPPATQTVSLYSLWKTDPEGGYASDLGVHFRFEVSQFNQMHFKHTKCYVKAHTIPQKNAEENIIMESDAEIGINEDSVFTVDVIDSLENDTDKYYEGS